MDLEARFSQLIERIENRAAVVAVIGLGYVGLPIACSFAEIGFDVLGIDLRKEKVRLIQEGRSHLIDIPHERIASLQRAGRFRATTSFDPIGTVDVMIICVPTPIEKGQPDLSNVVFAGESLARYMGSSTLVVLESTTYPGTTEELLKPLLEVGGLQAGTDFLLAYSPERIDPGNPDYDFADIPKVVGGYDDASTHAASLLYQQVVPKVVRVSGTREAEMSKLIENTFRHVNIALVNELALYSKELGLDIWEAIEAAASKPFGFMPFWPSPGWGGHCIPLDPAYLSWKVRGSRSHEIRFIELAQTLNSEMPRHVVQRCAWLLNDQGKSIRHARILGVGIAYKAGTQDTRESAGLKVLSLLDQRGAEINYHDPLVDKHQLEGKEFSSVELTVELVRSQDLIVVFIPQHGVDWDLLASESKKVFDCCNGLRRKAPNIERL
jgi:UDP-N-acetyl-D-glucosamine dehydrogenase